MSKYIELAKKLKALVDRGIGGEKSNASRMLMKLLKEHNLTMEDIEQDEIIEHWTNLRPDEIELYHQIVKRVNHKIKLAYITDKKAIKKYQLVGNVTFKCTSAEHIEIEAMFGVYFPHLKKELETFNYAFYMSNDLLAKVPDDERVKIEDGDPEAIEKYYRAKKMSGTINSQTYRKQIT